MAEAGVKPGVAVKHGVAWTLLRSGLLSLHRVARQRSRATILLYHRVNDEDDPFFPALRVEHFVAQLEYLACHYRVEPLETVLDWLEQGAPGPARVAITIDDGYPDTREQVLPVLERLGLPATLFLCTGPPETGHPVWIDRARGMLKHARGKALRLPEVGLADLPTDSKEARLRACGALLPRLKRLGPADIAQVLCRMEEQLNPGSDRQALLSWNDVQRLARGPVALGAHTHNHYLLAHLDDATIAAEITSSVELINARVGVRPRAFAYPNGDDGDYDGRCIPVFRSLGLRSALSSRHGLARPGADVWQLPRVYTSGTSLGLFATRIGGVGLAWRAAGERRRRHDVQ
jgi:peptidoglycan/xylan/chitin deacetylase (PgdA/CDA1 family)